MLSRTISAYRSRLAVTVLCILSLLMSSVPHPLANVSAQAGEEPERSRSNHNTQIKVLGPSSVRINTWNGNLFYAIPLLTIPGRGLSTELSMSYNSRWHDFATPYGYGWQFSYNVFYVRDDSGDIILVWGDGSTDKFTNMNRGLMIPTPPFFLSPPDVPGTLREYKPGKYVLRSKHGTAYYFDSPIHTRITRIQEPNGNSLNFTYYGEQCYRSLPVVCPEILLTTITDASGRQIILDYDDDDRLVSIIDPNGTSPRSIQFQYDVADNLTSVVDALGNVTNYSYDSEHYLTGIAPPRGISTTITYSSGAVTNVTGELTSKSFSYDTANRITTMADSAPEGNQTTRFHYDADGRIASIEDPLGHSVSMSWDDSNNLTSFKDQDGQRMMYAYDSMGNLLTVTDALSNTTAYTYESTYSKLTSITNANGDTTVYQYDSQGNLASETDPLGHATTYAYDSFGNAISRVDANRNETTYGYDDYGNLITVTYPSSVVSYSYDAVGNVTGMTNTYASMLYAYDALNRVTNVNYASHGKVISYTYDAVGNRTSMTDPDGGITRYTYDNANRLLTLTNPLSQTTRYTYDSRGRLIRKDYHNGTYAIYQYDKSNRLLSLVNSKSTAEVISSYTYEYDAAGNRTKMTEANGDETSYAYDGLYQLTGVRYPDGSTVEYTYDAVGNRLVLTDTTGTTAYDYDDADRLLGAGTVTYSWDNNGNLIRKTDESGTTRYVYDYENRLISITFPDGSANTFTYYPDGRRLSKTGTSGETVYYFYDGINAVVEANSAGATIARYTSGLEIDDWISMDRGGSSYSYHHDGLGTVTGLSNPSEALIATYKYDVFGTIRSRTGSVVNPYTFAGREYEEDSGFYYCRSRYYDAGVGRFTIKDPWRGAVNSPQTLHRYMYVSNSPVNYMDPLGYTWDYLDAEETVNGVLLVAGGVLILVSGPGGWVYYAGVTVWFGGAGAWFGWLFDPRDGGSNGGSPVDPAGPVGSGGGGGIESGPSRPVSHATLLARETAPMQPLFTLQDVLPTEGPENTAPVFVTPQGTLEKGNAVDARAVDFRRDPNDKATTVAVALVTKTLTETYWHDYSVCARFNGYTLDTLTPISLSDLAGTSSGGDRGPWLWHSFVYSDSTLEEDLIFSVFVNEAQRKFEVDSQWIRTEYACHWREPTSQPFDYVLNYQVWSYSASEAYRLLVGVFDKLSEVGPGWTITSTSGTEPTNPTVIMPSADLVGSTVSVTVKSWLPEPRLVLFHGTKRVCLHCNDIPFEYWEVVNPGLDVINLPIGDISNAVIYSEADGFLDKVYVERGAAASEVARSGSGRELPGSPGRPPTLDSRPLSQRRFPPSEARTAAPSDGFLVYLPVVFRNWPAPDIDIVWPPDGASVIVEKDLTDEVDSYRLTIHGTVHGMRPGWTILAYVFTDDWYLQEEAVAVEGELWGTRVHLAGKGLCNNHKIHVILLDERGRAIATDMVTGIVRVNPCAAP